MVFPDTPLRSGSPAANAFLRVGCSTFSEAARYLHQLPYGRNTERSHVLLVLSEQRGTCSSKHALLALLARELSVELELVMGIYMMNGNNTPGVGSVLLNAGLLSLPEAHCVVRYQGSMADITRITAEPVHIPDFIYEEVITPEQVADYKVDVHKAFVRQWCNCEGLDFDTVWLVRELCIAAL